MAEERPAQVPGRTGPAASVGGWWRQRRARRLCGRRRPQPESYYRDQLASTECGRYLRGGDRPSRRKPQVWVGTGSAQVGSGWSGRHPMAADRRDRPCSRGRPEIARLRQADTGRTGGWRDSIPTPLVQPALSLETASPLCRAWPRSLLSCSSPPVSSRTGGRYRATRPAAAPALPGKAAMRLEARSGSPAWCGAARPRRRPVPTCSSRRRFPREPDRRREQARPERYGASPRTLPGGRDGAGGGR